MNSKCNKKECNTGESLFPLRMKEILEIEELDALGKAQHTIWLSYFEIPEDISHWSIQFDFISHVLFSILTWENTETQLDSSILLWYQDDLIMTFGEFLL